MIQVFRDPPDDVVLLNLQAMSNPGLSSFVQAMNDPGGSRAISTIHTPSGAEMHYDGRRSSAMPSSEIQHDLDGFSLHSSQCSGDPQNQS
jgi:hypothetical protein